MSNLLANLAPKLHKFQTNDISIRVFCWEMKESDTWIVPIIVSTSVAAHNYPVFVYHTAMFGLPLNRITSLYIRDVLGNRVI